MATGSALSARRRKALDAICDTFAPGGAGTPSASALGVPAAVADAVALNPRASERRQVAQLLDLWNSPLLTALGGGGLKHFDELAQEERERVLLSWADSRVPQRRAAFQALRKGALLFYYMLPGPDGGRSPVWDAIDYSGPLGAPPTPPAKDLRPLAVDRDMTLECDVCIVGSGAGGGTAAGVLAAKGLDVVILEAGSYFAEEDFDGSELGALTRYYSPAPQGSHDQSVTLVAGSCVGGGTVVNYSTSFRTPDDVREEWAGHGVPAFAAEEYTRSLDAVCERLGVNQEQSGPSARDQLMQRACVELGWHVDAMPRNVTSACDGGRNCGYCGLGCRHGAKQSTAKTWLRDAQDAGARIVARTRAERVIVENGVARGVAARTADGHAVTVRARAVVAACGALHTPALLRRSGVRNENVGKHLKLHPVTVAFGVFDEQIKPWEGAMQALYSDEHRYLDGGYGVKYETGPMHPHLMLPFAPWRGGRQHHELMGALAHTSPLAALVRDRDGGEVRVGRDGEPVVRWRLSDYDAAHMRTGLEGAARILETAGAERIYSSHAKLVSYRPRVDGDLARFMRDADAAGYGPGQCQYGSFHLMGTARMGGTPATSACAPTGETWDVRDLYVCDGSSFPSASGVNPMISIESIAHMTASGIAARLS